MSRGLGSLGPAIRPRRSLTVVRAALLLAFGHLSVDMARYFVGTAGWSIPKQQAALFPPSAKERKLSHLERYANRLHCVEINSSFYRPHRYATWERWAGSVPDDFRFAVKVPKTITHSGTLVKSGAALQEFLRSVAGLGRRLGPLLIQLPPKHAFEEDIAHDFFATLRKLHIGEAVLEPRHESWFTTTAEDLLRNFKVARVAADPPKGSPVAARPGGWSGLRYWRLHGAPQTYYSDYDEAALVGIANTLTSGTRAGQDTWVIFDNTALGHACANAIRLRELLAAGRGLDQGGSSFGFERDSL